MTQLTTVLELESGVQYDGVKDGSEETGYYPIQGLIVGYFRRGRFDKPMTITQANIRGVLGFDFQNPYYRMVQDVLNEGLPSVQVLRLGAIHEQPNTGGGSGGGGLETPVELQKFDFAVIRYKWTSQSGQDLDTRTLITSPPRNVMVGWDKADSDSGYLTWGGDNTGSGVEAVLIDVKRLQQGYANTLEFLVQIRAFWFNSRGTGNITIEFESYKNGSMSQSGYDFVSVGGQQVQKLTVNVNCNSTEKADGQLLATLSYNPSENTGRLF